MDDLSFEVTRPSFESHIREMLSQKADLSRTEAGNYVAPKTADYWETWKTAYEVSIDTFTVGSAPGSDITIRQRFEADIEESFRPTLSLACNVFGVYEDQTVNDHWLTWIRAWGFARSAAPNQTPEQSFTVSALIQQRDFAALSRFHECAMDSESGGHDVAKDKMERLAEIGLVQSKGFGRYQVTTFGHFVLESGAGSRSAGLPLKTYREMNEESRQRSLVENQRRVAESV